MTERKNITQPHDWWLAFIKQAEAEGLTLSEWVGECCRANVPAKRLSERITRGKGRTKNAV